MRTAILKSPGGLDELYITEQPIPVAGPGQVLVRIKASSLNYHDLLVVKGQIPVADGRVPMSDGAGVVEAIGEGVTRFKAGDNIVSTFFPDWHDGVPASSKLRTLPGDRSDGFATEYVAMPEEAFTLAPQGYTHAEAATLTCAGVTAWRALMVEARIKPGDWVLTQGTGGVSIFALQFAKAAGARVIATSSSDEKLAKLQEMGADAVINYRSTPEWGKAVKSLTGNRGVDVVIEVGGPATLKQSIKACINGGHISVIGFVGGSKGNFSPMAILGPQLTLKGIFVGSRAHQEDMIMAIEANGIKPVVDRSFPLEVISDAFDYQISQKHFGKIALDI